MGAISLLIFVASSAAAFSWDDNYFNTQSLDDFIRYLFQFEVKPEPLTLRNTPDPNFVPTSVTFDYNGEEVTYGTIAYAGLVWMDRNLGAERVAQNKEDELGFGDYFQWGREDDGHQVKSSEMTEIGDLADAGDQPNHEKFILSRENPRGWNEDDLWSDRWENPSLEEADVNICPEDWHVTTSNEWTEVLKEIPENTSDMLYETLKMPMAGYRRNHDGYLQWIKTYGHYWSSNYKNKFHARSFMFNDKGAYTAAKQRALGLSVRCVMNRVIVAE